MNSESPVDLLRESAKELQTRLADGKLTSVQLVDLCLAQIDKYDQNGPRLRAMIALAPRDMLRTQAENLDTERKEGRVRGPLHGIPVVVKDIYDMDPSFGLPTTAGSKALLSSKVSKRASIIEKLVDNGLIVLGKTNLSEFGAAKGEKQVGGLSAVGGQANSPYIKGGTVPGDTHLAKSNPGGSSTGSAIAVAAGYAPLSVGGEADGSIGTPASRAALYGLKCTPGTMNTTGMLQVSPTFETPGGMAKTPTDLAALIKVLKSATIDDLSAAIPTILPNDFENMTLGFVDPGKWHLPESLLAPDEKYTAEVRSSYERVVNKLRELKCNIHYPVDLTHPFDPIFKYDGKSGYLLILLSEIRESVNAYLATLESSKIRSMADLIQYNKDHPEDQAGLDQLYHIQAEEDCTTSQVADDCRRAMREAARGGAFDKVMDEHGLDVIITPMDSPISTIAALAGYPIGTMPIGVLSDNGRPFGFAVVAKAGEEAKILNVMGAYEANFGPRSLPSLLTEAQSKLV